MSLTDVASNPRSLKICAAARQISARRASRRGTGAERRWAAIEPGVLSARPTGRSVVQGRLLRDRNFEYEKLERSGRVSAKRRGKTSTEPGTTAAQWHDPGLVAY